jgi:flagellar motility protein MotE (MotC chaperone)
MPFWADIEEEEVFEESAEAINEDVADTFRKVFDKPASSETQQKWEDEITDLQLALEKETDENKKRRIEKRIKQLEDKFAQQRDYEKRHEDEDLEELLDVSVPVNVTANGNDVAVGGLTK